MSYIFFGWLLVFINFRVNGFDILPDFIGYALIFAGVNSLSVKSNYFNRARIFALIMCVVSFGELVQQETITIESEFFMMLLMAVNVFLIIIPLYLMYLITKGVGELEWDVSVYLGADILMRLWKINVIVTLLLWTVGFLSVTMLNIFSGVLILAAVMMICVLIVNIAWVICFYRSKKRYDEVDNSMITNQNQPDIQAKSVLLALSVCMLICGLILLSYSEYASVMRDGISYVERAGYDNYRFSEYPVQDSERVVIDWNDVQASIGQEIYNDGKCVIYISAIEDDKNGGYDIFFKTKGDFDYWKGRLVTPLSHMDNLNRDGNIALQGIHQNWPNDAVLQVAIGEKTYLSKKWRARVQAVDKDGDEIGYPMFALEYYERGEMILTDEIRQNDNQVTIRLIGLRELTYERR